MIFRVPKEIKIAANDFLAAVAHLDKVQAPDKERVKAMEDFLIKLCSKLK